MESILKELSMFLLYFPCLYYKYAFTIKGFNSVDNIKNGTIVNNVCNKICNSPINPSPNNPVFNPEEKSFKKKSWGTEKMPVTSVFSQCCYSVRDKSKLFYFFLTDDDPRSFCGQRRSRSDLLCPHFHSG